MLHYKTIQTLQKLEGYSEIQALINSGEIWKFSGSEGRNAMQLLEIGVCMLPKKATFDYYGNRIPSRTELKQGTKGNFLKYSNDWNNNY